MEINSTIYNPQYSPPSKIVVNVFSYGDGAKPADQFRPFQVGGADLPSDQLGQPQIKDQGTYNITETPDSEYTTLYTGDCVDDGSGSYGTLELGVNDYKTCNIINTLKPQTASLTVVISSDGVLPEQLTVNGKSYPSSTQQQIKLTAADGIWHRE